MRIQIPTWSEVFENARRKEQAFNTALFDKFQEMLEPGKVSVVCVDCRSAYNAFLRYLIRRSVLCEPRFACEAVAYLYSRSEGEAILRDLVLDAAGIGPSWHEQASKNQELESQYASLYEEAREQYSEGHLRVIDKRDLSWEDPGSDIWELIDTIPGLVVVDDLMSWRREGDVPYAASWTDAAYRLSRLARELHVPVIAALSCSNGTPVPWPEVREYGRMLDYVDQVYSLRMGLEDWRKMTFEAVVAPCLGERVVLKLDVQSHSFESPNPVDPL